MTYFQQDSEGFGKQLPKNLFSNVALLAINMAIGIFITPYYIHTLGVAAYGLIPLVATLTNYLGLIINSLNYTVSRYLTVDLQKNDFREANITFNTALFGTLGLIFITAIIILLIAVNVPSIFQIPLGREYDAILLFLGVNFAFLVRTWGGNFSVSFFAYNRIDLRNLIEIINRILQVFLIVALFSVLGSRLSFVGLAYVIAAFLAFWATFLFWKRITPQLRIKAHNFNSDRFKEMLGTGGWLIIDSIGALLFLQIDLILVNLLYGSVAGGEYAVIFQWSTLVWTIGAMIAGVITPMVIIYYAKEKISEIITLSKTSIKIMGFTMGLPVSLLCGFAPELLSLWVGPEFVKLTPLMWILTGHLAMNISLLPLIPINVSYNRVRTPGIVTLFMGIGSVILAIILSQYLGLGIYGIAAAGAITLTCKNAIFTPWYSTKRVMGISLRPYFKPILAGLLSVVFTSIFIIYISPFLNITSWFYLGFYSAVIGVAYVLIVWFVGINKNEQKYLLSMLPPTIQRRLP